MTGHTGLGSDHRTTSTHGLEALGLAVGVVAVLLIVSLVATIWPDAL
jgi:hypothetical protein